MGEGCNRRQRNHDDSELPRDGEDEPDAGENTATTRRVRKWAVKVATDKTRGAGRWGLSPDEMADAGGKLVCDGGLQRSDVVVEDGSDAMHLLVE